MRTKQLIFAVLLCGPFLFVSTQAQSLYFGLGAGYGFAAAKQTFGIDQKSSSGSGSSTSEVTSRSISFGKGINAGLYVGYMFNKNMGAELGLSYLLGGKNIFTYESTGPGSNSFKRTETYKGKMIRIVPAIRLTAGEKKFHPYMKAGLILGLAAKVTEERHWENANPNLVISEEGWEYSGGMSLGFHGAFGFNYMISDQLGIFAELAANYQNWAPKKASMTKSTVDGVDQMANMKTKDKETEFVESYTTDGTPQNVDVADKQLKSYLPFSSFGINIGIHFVLGGSKAE